MRFTYLDLRAFGHFTDHRVDFSPERSFHLIYGPNEAGKSTFLRAISDVLYGIPERTTDAFRHPNQSLRIGAGLQRSDGRELAFLRRKGRSRTLLDLDETALDQALLDAYLAGVDRQAFELMFGLNHQRLTQGGKDLLQSGGNLGESLFAAASGIGGLRELLAELDEEAKKLFLPSGTRPIINAEVARYKAARSKVSEASLSARDWEELEAKYREEKAAVDELIDKIKRLSEEKTKLDRVSRTLPLLSNRQRCQAELAEIGDIPMLPPTARQDRLELQQQEKKACEAKQRAEDKLAALHAQKAALKIPEGLLAHKDAISKLSEGLGQYRQNIATLPKLQGEIAQVEQSVDTLLSELYPQTAASMVIENYRPAIQDVELTKELAAKHSILLERLQHSALELATIKDSLAENEDKQKRLVSRPDSKELRRALGKAQKDGDLEEQLRTLVQEIEQAEKQLLLDVQKLALWVGDYAQLIAIATPMTETVQRFSELMESGRQELAEVDKELQRTRREIGEFTKRLHQIKHLGDVPCEEDLAAARQHREKGWQLVRQAWLAGSLDEQAVQEYAADRALPEAYETAVITADKVADRMRLESTQVAEKASLLANLETFNQKLVELAEQKEQLEAAGQALTDQWHQLWQPCGLTPLSPPEMLAWLDQRAKIIAQATDLAKLRTAAETIEVKIADHRRLLNAALSAQGEKVAETAPLDELILQATEVCSEIDKAVGSLQSLQNEADSLRIKLKSAERKKATDEESLAEWQAAWIKAMEKLGLAADTTPTVALAFLTKLGQLFTHIDNLAASRLQHEQLAQAVTEFEQQAAELLAKVSLELPEQAPDLTIAELKRRAEQAGQDQATITQLDGQIAEYIEASKEADQTIRSVTAGLQALLEAANCQDLAELEQAEELAVRAGELRQKIDELADRLIESGAGLSLEEISAEAQGINPDTLPGELDELERQLAQLDQERSGLEQQFGATKKEYEEKIHGTSTAGVEAAEEAENILATLESQAAQYTRLKLASAILRIGIDQYREQHQSPVVRRAGEFFARLTLGSFSGLKIDYDDGDNPVLIGVRPSGETVGVAGMSDGTQDQLYLALRLASIEQYLQQAEPMPLVVDDILVNFDDERSRETLRVLADLSDQTQLIFFTHHRSLVELAKAEVPERKLAVYRLGAG